MEQLPKESWDEIGIPIPIATLPITADEFASKYDIELFEVCEAGLVTTRSCVLKIEQTQYWFDFYANVAECLVSVRSFEPDLDVALCRVLKVMGYEEIEVMWRFGILGQAEWRLYRIDDTGNRTELYRFHYQSEAEHTKQRYEARDGKHSYVVEKKHNQ